MKSRPFFRWLPTAIILWVFFLVFALAAGCCLRSAQKAAHIFITIPDSQNVARFGASHQMAEWYLHGALADGSVALLCVLGWYFMRRHLSGTLALGGIAVTAAAFIIGQRSIIYLFQGAGFKYWFDLVLELPFLFYVIIYAYRECRRSST